MQSGCSNLKAEASITYVVRIFLLLTFAAGASAQDSRGGYMGAAVGQAYYKHTCEGAPAGVTCSNDDTAARFLPAPSGSRASPWRLAFTSSATSPRRAAVRPPLLRPPTCARWT